MLEQDGKTDLFATHELQELKDMLENEEYEVEGDDPDDEYSQTGIFKIKRWKPFAGIGNLNYEKS